MTDIHLNQRCMIDTFKYIIPGYPYRSADEHLDGQRGQEQGVWERTGGERAGL